MLHAFENSVMVFWPLLPIYSFALVVWFKSDQIRSNWFKLVQIGLNQINLDQIGSNWIKLYIIGFNEINWTKLDQTGSKREQIGSNQLKLDQIWSPWFSKKKNLGGKLTFKSCTLWSNWIELDQIIINWSAKIWGWGLVPHPCHILCLVIFDYWETWLTLV